MSQDSRTFPTSADNDGYVCLSLGYMAVSAIIQATGLHKKENMYFILEQLVMPEGSSEWTVKKTYPVLLKGTEAESVRRAVRNLMPGEYRVKQFKAPVGDTPWAWAYEIIAPSSGEIQKKVTKEDGIENLFPFTVKHAEGDDNVLHDEELKENLMLGK